MIKFSKSYPDLTINIQYDLSDDGTVEKIVDVQGRFYNGYLEDWWADTKEELDGKTQESMIQKLYDAYADEV